jgi:hypothetical protein
LYDEKQKNMDVSPDVSTAIATIDTLLQNMSEALHSRQRKWYMDHYDANAIVGTNNTVRLDDIIPYRNMYIASTKMEFLVSPDLKLGTPDIRVSIEFQTEKPGRSS